MDDEPIVIPPNARLRVEWVARGLLDLYVGEYTRRDFEHVVGLLEALIRLSNAEAVTRG